MNKPIIQIKIEGAQGSGKTTLTSAIKDKMEELGYACKSPASSYDPDTSVHAENDFHVVQIREKQVGMMAYSDVIASKAKQSHEIAALPSSARNDERKEASHV